MQEHRTHKDLAVWQRSMDMVVAVYRATECMPKAEVYGLTSQIRRAAVSVSANIAEGAARNHAKEFVQFLYIALGSLAELETELLLAERLQFMELTMTSDITEIKMMLLGLIKAVKKKDNQ